MLSDQHVNKYNIKFFQVPFVVQQKIMSSKLAKFNVRNAALAFYTIYFNLRKASENNDDFYSDQYKDHYIIMKNKDLKAIEYCNNNDLISKAKKFLKTLGLIRTVSQKWNQPDLIFLPTFKRIMKSITQTNQSFSYTQAKTAGRPNDRSHNNNTSKTYTRNNTRVNTKTSQSHQKFQSMDRTQSWSDSAKTLGLTLDTIENISRFSSTYNKSAYKITSFIIEARDIIANQNHVSKKARGFETNNNIKHKLGSKVWKLLSYISKPNHQEVKLSNFAGWFINSLKNFFYEAFGLKQDDPTVTPKAKHNKQVNNQKHLDIEDKLLKQNITYNNNAPKTDPSLQRDIQARLKRLGEY